MTRQKSERGVVPQGRRKTVPTEGAHPRGGKAAPVEQQPLQLRLWGETAEDPRAPEGAGGCRRSRSSSTTVCDARSERAGQRVMASVARFIEGRLRLEVNLTKSAVARPETRHFLGFSLRREPLDGHVEVMASTRTRERLRATIRAKTPRNYGGSLLSCIRSLNAYLVGCLGFFGICTDSVRVLLRATDAHIRRRLRALTLKDWKSKRTTAQKLIALGVKPKTAWRRVYEGRKSLWALSATAAVERGLRNAYFAERGLVSLEQRWTADPRRIAAPVQLALALG